MKNYITKFKQAISVGILFALTLGGFSYYFAKDNLVKSESEDLVIILEIKNNDIVNDIKNFQLEPILNFSSTLTKELLHSFEYSKIRYSGDERLSGGCINSRFDMNFNTIFIRKDNIKVKDKEKFLTCMDNFFFLAFERLKQNFIPRFKAMVDLNENNNLSEEKCIQLQILFNKFISRFNLLLENDSQLNSDFDLDTENLIQLLNFHQNFTALQSLFLLCNADYNSSLTNIAEYNNRLSNNFYNKFSGLEFEQIFKFENIYLPKSQTFLSVRNTIFSFALFGFIFGVFIFYQFWILKKKDE